MKRPELVLILTGFFLVVMAGPALSAPAGPASPLDVVEFLHGPVEVKTQGTLVVINFREQGGPSRTFRVDGADLGRPVSFQTSSSRLVYWMGHLVLLNQEKGRAWHFYIPAVEESNKKRPGVRPEPEGLDALLADYEVTRVVANEISSHTWRDLGASLAREQASTPAK